MDKQSVYTNKVVLVTIADFLINAATAWFAAGFAALFTQRTLLVKAGLLTVDMSLGIVCLIIAVLLRKSRKK